MKNSESGMGSCGNIKFPELVGGEMRNYILTHLDRKTQVPRNKNMPQMPPIFGLRMIPVFGKSD